MNSNNIGQIETVINIKEVIWDLLEQWKAVLISAILMAVLVAGAKYAKDMQYYDAAQAEKKVEQQNTASVEEQIDAVLLALPESERSTVMAIVNQNEWIATEKDYVNKSILLNTDPTNQRTLVADYYIKAEEAPASARNSLIYGYTTYLKDAHAAEALKEVIASDTDINYITELIDAENSKDDREGSEAYDAILTVNVVLPDGADVQKVQETLTSLIKEKAHELSGIYPHDIDLISAGEAYLYNKDAVRTRTDTLTSIYNLQNYTKNMQTSLSDGQKAALETITTIKVAEKTASKVESDRKGAADTKNTKPGFSKKYALLGFVLGVMLYAFIYLLIVIRRGCLLCAGDACLYTSSRLLGEFYEQTEMTGIKALLKSRLVEKYRYGSRLDTMKQTEKMRSSIEAVCRHEGLKELTVFDQSAPEKLKDMIIREIKELGIKVTEISAGEDINERDLCDSADAIFLVSNMTKVSALCGLTELLKDYDIRSIGAIFASEL